MLLKRGDKGDAVSVLQRDLDSLGSMVLVDSKFEAETEAAVTDARVTLTIQRPPEADDGHSVLNFFR
jgi:hypothetical protein